MTQWHRRGADPKDLSVLYPGVPPWIEPLLCSWVDEIMTERKTSNIRVKNRDLFLEFESLMREENSHVRSFVSDGAKGVLQEAGEDYFLDFVDFLVYKISTYSTETNKNRLKELDLLLEQGGSEWRVGKRDGHASLEKRVPEGVRVAAEETIQSTSSAGLLLAEAWHAVFGRTPDPEEAYEKAIKAVEEAGAGIVSPRNSKATLGTMLSQMKQQGGWKLPLPGDSSDVVTQMIEALWKGQGSRHGGNGYRKPTNEEAECAVLLAVPIVQWFSAGHLRREAK